MKKKLSNFLRKYRREGDRLLLACSGGPDSLALLHLLHEERVAFGVAHVDHGWRKESGDEAEQLRALCEELGHPFYCRKLDPSGIKGNLEAACRNARLAFFKEICEAEGYRAVLLGHHANDKAETVLKRALEGATLTALTGPQEVSVVEGVVLWRPLLHVRKKEILAWIKERGLAPFHDVTNDDPRYLRARFRQQILPGLAEQFGKEIDTALCHLGNQAEELSDYLDSRVAPYLCVAKELDLSEKMPAHDVELKHLIRRFCQREKIALSREQVGTVVSLLRAKKANKKVGGLMVDRGVVTR